MHCLGYTQRTEIALELVKQVAQEGHCPQAHSAFDNGGLRLGWTRCIEAAGKHWGRELACSRHRQWQGQWRRVEAVAAALRHAHPDSFRPVRVRCRHGETQSFLALTNVGRLKR